MKVQVAYADADGEMIVDVDVADDCRVRDAITQSGVLAHIGVPHDELDHAIFGRRVEADACLSSGDRVEITRPLARDAKAARRERAARTSR